MPRLHLADDTHGNPLSAHWTCAHLLTRRREGGGFYPACALGTAAERVRWAMAIKDGQLAAIRLARVALSQFIRPDLEAVRQLLGNRSDGADRPRRAEVQAAWSRLVAVFNRFVAAEPGLFEAAGIQGDALQQCFAEAMAEFSGRQWGREWQMAESVVSRYPWPIVAFFRPDLVRDGAVAAAEPPE
ncbi:MAG: hypothetical protein M3Z98_01440 [Candidatus Dormibacteraeota bacterium]|nr:hypothetical protein [Candidatus Dormibacteraeota bacterium]